MTVGPFTCRWLLMVPVLLLAGCSTFSPRYTIPPRAKTLEQAEAQIDVAIDSLQTDIKEQDLINGFTGIGTFLGAAGAALSPVFKGTRDLTVGLAAFGATNYAVNSIYSSRVATGIRVSGLETLLCVRNAAGSAVSSHQKIEMLMAGVTEAGARVSSRLGEIKPQQPAEQELAGLGIATADNAMRSANARFANEAEIADQISGAVQNILKTVNKQLQAVMPDVAAIQRAGSGISTAALAGVSQQGSGQTSRSLTTLALNPDLDEQLVTRLAGLTSAVDQLTKALEAPLSPFNSDSCKVSDLPATAAMATNAPASFEMKLDSAPRSYKVTGGSGLYTVSWKGEQPAAMDAAMQADTLKIFVKREAKAADFTGQQYELDVYDSTPGSPKHLPDTIKISAAKP